MKIENRKTYLFFRQELEELLAQGFSREQATLILRKIHHAIDVWKGYHYEHISRSAGESLNYLIDQVTTLPCVWIEEIPKGTQDVVA